MSQLQPIVKQEAPARRSIDTSIIPQVSTSKSEVLSPRNYTPKELRDLRAWLPWIKQPKPNSDRFRKAPVDTNGYPLADWRSSSAWRSYASVIAQSADGVGIVAHGLLIVIDLDDCVIDPTKHTLTRFALHVYHRCKSYAEVSPSGKGIKIFARVTADVLAELKSFKGDLQGESVAIELLHSGMFATITGRKLYAQTPDTLNDVSDGIRQIMAILPAPASRTITAPAPAPQRQSAELDKTVIDNYNQKYTALDILSRNGAKRYQGNLWHCVSSICPVHTGRDGSLYLKRSDKYGVVVKALNSACVLHSSNRGGPAYIAAFDVMRFYECSGNMGEALKQARQELNQPITRLPLETVKVTQPIPPPVIETVADTTRALQDTLLKIGGDIRLTPAARKLINLLMTCVDSNACVQIDVPALATHLCVQDRTIQRATNQLIDLEYIRKYSAPNKVGGNGANVYQLVTCHVTPYLNSPQSDQPNADVVLRQERGGNDVTSPVIAEPVATPAPAVQATKAAPVKTTTDHGDEQPIPCSPLPCPSSVDIAGLQSFIYTLLMDKKYQLVYASDGELARWSSNRLIDAVQCAFGDVFTPDQLDTVINAAREKARKAKAVAVFNEYREHVKGMTLKELKKAAKQKLKLLKQNKGGPREAFFVAMNDIAQRELQSREVAAKPQSLFDNYAMTKSA